MEDSPKDLGFWDKYDHIWEFVSRVANGLTLLFLIPYLVRAALTAASPTLGVLSFVAGLILRSGAIEVQIPDNPDLLAPLVKRFVKKEQVYHEAKCTLSVLILLFVYFWAFVGAPSISEIFYSRAEELHEKGDLSGASSTLAIAQAVYGNVCYKVLQGTLAENKYQDYDSALEYYNEASSGCFDWRGLEAAIGILRVLNLQQFLDPEDLEKNKVVALAERFYFNLFHNKYRFKNEADKNEKKGIFFKQVAWTYINDGQLKEAEKWIYEAIKLEDYTAYCLELYLTDKEDKLKAAEFCIASLDYGFPEANIWKKKAEEYIDDDEKADTSIFGTSGGSRSCLITSCERSQFVR